MNSSYSEMSSNCEQDPEEVNSKFRLSAIILAGGPGKKMGATGQLIPTVFLPIGLDPVINTSVQKCHECDDINYIWVLTRKKCDDLQGGKLETWVNNWITLIKETELGKTKNLTTIFEEDLDSKAFSSEHGSVVAIYRFISTGFIKDLLAEEAIDNFPTHILIVAGDNYITSDFSPLINAAKCYPEACLLYTSPSPRDRTRSRMPSSA